MPAGDPILICGGGLGGLTAALALARRGWRSRVLEGADEFGGIGYGIQFGPNVFHVFERIGVTDAVMAAADCPPALLMRDALTGDVRLTIPAGRAIRERFRHPYIIIHRIDLHHALLDACRRLPEIELIPGAMVTGFEESGDRIGVETADGRRFSGVALVGADGIHSFIRFKIIGDGEPRPIGYVAHRTIVPMPDVAADVHRQEVVLWSGPGFHIVHYRFATARCSTSLPCSGHRVMGGRAMCRPIGQSLRRPTATLIRRCTNCSP
jgi:salicylate hydroxylase